VIETCTDDYNVKINASETTISQITEVFDIKLDKGKRWTLAEDSLVEVPSMLSMCQHSSLAYIHSGANYCWQSGTCVT
jgi:hypothetical protein